MARYMKKSPQKPIVFAVDRVVPSTVLARASTVLGRQGQPFKASTGRTGVIAASSTLTTTRYGQILGSKIPGGRVSARLMNRDDELSTGISASLSLNESEMDDERNGDASDTVKQTDNEHSSLIQRLKARRTNTHRASPDNENMPVNSSRTASPSPIVHISALESTFTIPSVLIQPSPTIVADAAIANVSPTRSNTTPVLLSDISKGESKVSIEPAQINEEEDTLSSLMESISEMLSELDECISESIGTDTIPSQSSLKEDSVHSMASDTSQTSQAKDILIERTQSDLPYSTTSSSNNRSEIEVDHHSSLHENSIAAKEDTTGDYEEDFNSFDDVAVPVHQENLSPKPYILAVVETKLSVEPKSENYLDTMESSSVDEKALTSKSTSSELSISPITARSSSTQSKHTHKAQLPLSSSTSVDSFLNVPPVNYNVSGQRKRSDFRKDKLLSQPRKKDKRSHRLSHAKLPPPLFGLSYASLTDLTINTMLASLSNTQSVIARHKMRYLADNAVRELLYSQIDLIDAYILSSREIYTMLAESCHPTEYTTLEATRKYIMRHRPSVITFKKAMKMVKREEAIR